MSDPSTKIENRSRLGDWYQTVLYCNFENDLQWINYIENQQGVFD